MEAVAVTPPAGWNRLAPKTSCGTRERTPTCRGLTDWISDERETRGRVAASGMGQGARARFDETEAPLPPSCPRLSRASTPFLRAFSEKDVDGRDKPRHDAAQTSST